MRSRFDMKWAATIAAIVSVLLAGCGGSGPEQTPSPAATTLETETTAVEQTADAPSDAAEQTTAAPSAKVDVLQPNCNVKVVSIGRYVIRAEISEVESGTGMRVTGYFAQAKRVPNASEAKDPEKVEEILRSNVIELTAPKPRVDLNIFEPGTYVMSAAMNIEVVDEDDETLEVTTQSLFCSKLMDESTLEFIIE